MSERPRLTARDIAIRKQNAELRELLYGSPTFRKFLWTQLVQLGIFMPSHRGGSPTDTSFNDGRRAAGLDILHLFTQIVPDFLSVMETEGALLGKQTPQPGDEPDDDPFGTDE